MRKVLVIHGPNLNLLGRREPGIYGTVTLAEIDQQLRELAAELALEVTTFQSNSEGDIVTTIQQAVDWADAVIINAGAYTHTSLAIADALRAVKTLAIEVHLSNIFAREAVRQHSFLSPVCVGQICGFGAQSYLLALRAVAGLV